MSAIQVDKIHTLRGHLDCVYSIQIGKDTKDLFSAGGDGLVIQWNLEEPATGRLIAKLPKSIYALHYLSSKDLLIVGQNFEGIHLIDHSNKKQLTSLKLSNAYVFDIQSHDNVLFVASGNGAIVVIDIEGWKIIDHLEQTKQSARSIAICETRGEMAVGYSDNFIRVFDLSNHALKQEWLAHDNSVFTVRFNASGRYLLSGSRDAHLKVWDANDGYKSAHDIVAHLHTINHIVFSPDSKHFVTCSMDKSIKVWDSEGFKLLKVIDKTRHAGHGTSVNKLAWTSFNNQLVSASDDKTLSIWDIIFLNFDNNC